MCGLFGLVGKKARLSEGVLNAAHHIQRHRGPDSKGDWAGCVGNQWVTLGHQRLAIIDLSPAGRQPMQDMPSGAARIVFNGEMYNYVELRKELESEGVRFATRSDTEVMLAALRVWGLRKAHERFNGMWAFAYVDEVEGRLVLSRDRMGEKPLYYSILDGTLYFASEIKTILNLTGKRFPIRPAAVAEYLEQSLLDTTEDTFFEGIRKIPAGHYGIVDLKAQDPEIRLESYWVPNPVERDPYPIATLQEDISRTFDDSVRIRMRSDVPVGVLLSGGIDSSAIAATMAALAPDADLNLLSAVSDDSRYDESPFIDRMVDHLKRPVHKVRLALGPDNAIPLLERATWHNDEPVGSFGNVAHFLLMEKAKDLGITVILSGQGADELLCGYKKYLGFYVQWLLRRGNITAAARVVAGFAFNGTVIPQFQIAEARRYLPSHWGRKRKRVLGDALLDSELQNVGLGRGTVQERQELDLVRFSVPVLCHFEDRMSMAHSREIRLPFLDVRLIERMLPAPPQYKLRNGWTKYVFREAMAARLPAEIAWRKDKQGFVNPQAHWLRERLRPVVLDLLRPDSLIFAKGLVNRDVLIARYKDFVEQDGERGGVYFREIFSPLALEIWMRQYESSLC
jgi:asparagine synthase (glutamine-hydrolysing)